MTHVADTDERLVEPDVFPGIYLGNAEPRTARRPVSFEIPPANVRRLLRSGDHAKLMFCARAAGDGVVAERMWVEITGRMGAAPLRYTGKVDNRAAVLAVPFGGLVTFGPEHIFDLSPNRYP